MDTISKNRTLFRFDGRRISENLIGPWKIPLYNSKIGMDVVSTCDVRFKRVDLENENESVFLDEPKSRDMLNALLEDIPTFTFTSKFTEKSILSSECDEL